jgi:ABC-type multidrug transport system ATPase subunit
MLEVRGVARRMGDRQVFRRLDFGWDAPRMLCVRGVNGAGKTTLLALLAGALAPDAGDILVHGRSLAVPAQQARELLAYVPDDCPVYPFLTGREWLVFVQGLRRCDDAVALDLLARFGLQPQIDVRFGAMSLGTARKFLLVSALMAVAPVLLLDEPTNGLDAASFEVLREYLAQRAQQGLVVLTCHDVGQQQRLGAETVELASLEAP